VCECALMVIVSAAAPLPRLALLICGVALAAFVRSRPAAAEDAAAGSFLATLTKLEGELESFMKAQHDDMAPDVTAHDYEKQWAADVEKLEQSAAVAAPGVLSSLGDRVDALDDKMEDFIEENHEELMPDVTAHDVEQRVVPELLEDLDELEDRITGEDDSDDAEGAEDSDDSEAADDEAED